MSRFGPADRDGKCCVHCGARLDAGTEQGSLHHRILGNTSDNRPSNKIVLAGTGNAGCHGWAHIKNRPEAERLGLIVSRHSPRSFTLATPVLYMQAHLGRVGWYLLDDSADLFGPLDAPFSADAGKLRRQIRAFLAGPGGGTTLKERQEGLRLLDGVPFRVGEAIIAEGV